MSTPADIRRYTKYANIIAVLKCKNKMMSDDQTKEATGLSYATIAKHWNAPYPDYMDAPHDWSSDFLALKASGKSVSEIAALRHVSTNVVYGVLTKAKEETKLEAAKALSSAKEQAALEAWQADKTEATWNAYTRASNEHEYHYPDSYNNARD